MGIRFFCPKGHKLHVKAFQAGKKGVCPDCGSRFVIPMESQRVSSKERKRGATADAASSASATSDAAAATHAMADQMADRATAEPVDDDAEPVEIQIAEDEQDETPVSIALPPTSSGRIPSGPASVSSSSDPVTEAPNAVWYVRPASGGQYGPARGEIMRRWLGEGRVASDSMVWREGWSDWKTANVVFPELNKQGSSKTSTTAVIGVTRPASVPQASALASPDNRDLLVSSGSVSSSLPSGSRMPAKSRGKNSLTIWIVAGLTLVVVLLAGALIYVLQRR